MKMLMNRCSQSTWYLICSQTPDYPPGTISAQVQIKVSEKEESQKTRWALSVQKGTKGC